MKFTPALQAAKMIKRYKRFLADVEMPDGRVETVHTPNTGPMTTCWEADWPVLLSHSPNPGRKYPYTLEMIHNGVTWIGINTLLPNRLVEESLLQGKIPELQGYTQWKREKKVGEGRLDFFLERDGESCYLEIKNVTLWGVGDVAFFPDTVSERGTKHLNILHSLKRKGARAVMLYVVQREDVQSFSPSFHLDPVYARTLESCHAEGVEILVYRCSLSPQEIFLQRPLPFSFLDRNLL